MPAPAYHTYDDALAGIKTYLRAGATMMARCKVWEERGYIRSNLIENAEQSLDAWFKDIGEPPMNWKAAQRDIETALKEAEAEFARSPAAMRAATPIAAE